MVEKINMVVGFDQRESIAYHTFTQSILDKSSLPVSFTPLAINTLKGYHETHAEKSNDFVYSRFLTPYLNGFSGWAIFADGDMICQADIKELWDLRDESKAVLVVKHDYKTKAQKKYLGNSNTDYPKKNWSSLILWNCAHPKHSVLTPDFISNQIGKFLHRFSWLEDEDIGDLPKDWNWLAIEYPENKNAKLIHYTLGTPCFKEYWDSEMSEIWHSTQKRAVSGMKV
jgi:lipopolysaccharide biosynthesis glycosyltransferase